MFEVVANTSFLIFAPFPTAAMALYQSGRHDPDLQHPHVEVVGTPISNAQLSLLRACEEGDVAGALRAIEGGADVDGSLQYRRQGGRLCKWTPLTLASFGGRAEVVRVLLVAYADVNTARTDSGATPLYAACQQSHADIVSMLLAVHADVNVATAHSGTTPLYAACERGHADIVSMLLAANAEINTARISNGWTPLHSACCNNQAEIAVTLLLANADLRRLDYNGRTALDVAGSEATRAAVRDVWPDRAGSLAALRFVCESTGLVPDVADVVVYHRYIQRREEHQGLADEYVRGDYDRDAEDGE